MINRIIIATIGVISTIPIRGTMRRSGANIGPVIRSRKTTVGLYGEVVNQERITRIKIMNERT